MYFSNFIQPLYNKLRVSHVTLTKLKLYTFWVVVVLQTRCTPYISTKHWMISNRDLILSAS